MATYQLATLQCKYKFTKGVWTFVVCEDSENTYPFETIHQALATVNASGWEPVLSFSEGGGTYPDTILFRRAAG